MLTFLFVLACVFNFVVLLVCLCNCFYISAQKMERINWPWRECWRGLFQGLVVIATLGAYDYGFGFYRIRGIKRRYACWFCIKMLPTNVLEVLTLGHFTWR